jgi:hypothetical protein
MQTLLRIVRGMISGASLLLPAMHPPNQSVPMSNMFAWNHKPVRMRLHEGNQCQEKMRDGGKHPHSCGQARIYRVSI